MERRSLSSRGPAEGLHPSFSYLPIPVRHTSTITLPSRCFKGGGWRLLHSLFLYSSSHPLSFTPPLLSGRRVFVVLLLLFVILRICSIFFSDFLWVYLGSLTFFTRRLMPTLIHILKSLSHDWVRNFTPVLWRKKRWPVPAGVLTESGSPLAVSLVLIDTHGGPGKTE